MTNRKILHTTALALFLTVTQGLWAEGLPSAGANPVAQFNQQMVNDLNLTAEQQPKVSRLNKRFFEDLKKIRKENTSRSNKMMAFREASQKRDRKMRDILNDEQMKTYETLRDERRTQMKAMRNSDG